MISKRTQLIEHLPLDTPFSLHIFPSFFCNFKCSYCIHCLGKKQHEDLGFKKQTMPGEVFQKAIDGLSLFKGKLKSIIFAGHGEPLTHPDITDFVKYAAGKAVSQRIEIVTNGSLLTNELSDALIGAGLTGLRVSLQGLNAEDYHNVCGIKTDFEKFVKNLEYFYTSKKNTEVTVKIVDVALKSQNSTEQFYSLFKPISDKAVIEYVFPFIRQINHKNINASMHMTKHGDGTAKKINICAMPFYMLVILPNGDVTGCCAVNPPVIYGNVMKNNLFEIWNDICRRNFLNEQINDRFANKECRNCTVPDYGMQSGDYLDEYQDKLREIFTEQQR